MGLDKRSLVAACKSSNGPRFDFVAGTASFLAIKNKRSQREHQANARQAQDSSRLGTQKSTKIVPLCLLHCCIVCLCVAQIYISSMDSFLVLRRAALQK